MSDRQKTKRLDFRVIIPNIVTLVALCSGVSAVKFALAGQMNFAATAILVSAILDGLDGQIARALRGASSFGAELDSLADLVNFGVAPALVLYVWGLNDLGNLGWFACLIFIIAMALRLARFNVANNLTDQNPSEESFEESDKKQTKPKAYFVGIPAPAAALLALMPLYFDLTGYIDQSKVFSIFIVIYLLLLSGFVVSLVKTFSPKSLRFRSGKAGVLFLMIALLAAALITFTWHSLIIIGTLYFGQVCLSLCKNLKNNKPSL